MPMKGLLLMACAAVALSTVSAEGATHSRFFARKAPASEIARKIEEVRKINRAAEEGSWLPGMTTLYSWDGDAWMEDGVVESTYSEHGRPLSVTTQGVIMRYEYDSDGRVSKLRAFSEDDPDTELMVYSFEYDAVVKSAIVKTVVSASMFGITFSETVGADVKRDADGNVTSVEQYSISISGERTPISSMKFEYGASGTATKMTVLQYEAGEVADEFWASDMQWHMTNGQMLSFGLSQEKFPVGLFDADNQLRHAYFTYLDEPDPIRLVVSDLDNGNYKMTYDVLGIPQETLEYTETDSFGSYKIHTWACGLNPSDGTDTMDYIHTVDSYGLVLEERTVECHYDYREVLPSSKEEYAVVGHVDYDSDYGYPEEYWTEEGEPESMDKASREVYSDYEFYLSGVEAVSAEGFGGDAEYFNLQGVKVAHPEGGIFIERRGSEVRKVFRH